MTANIDSRLRDIVGRDHAFGRADPAAAPYRRFDRLLADGATLVAVARPDAVEQVQAVMRLAGENGLGIVKLPNATGNAAVAMRRGAGSIALDLSRMNRIIEINTRSAYALLEPGVSYRQLYEHLRDQNIPFWVDCDRNGLHSIAGSIAGRRVGYTPYGDHMLMQCGMEVVLADGALVRTGMGALPRSNTWQLFKYSFGPYLDGLFTQSDLAVITKIGLWLMPAPPGYFPFMVTLPTTEALAAAVETMREFKINMVVPNAVSISHANLDAAPYTRREDFVEEGRVNEQRAANGRGLWNVYGALYGMPEIIDVTWPMVRGALAAIDGAEIFDRSERSDDAAWQDRQSLMQGIPLAEERTLAAWGGPEELGLSVAAPIEGTHAARLHEIVTEALSRHGRDYLCEYLLTWRTLIKQIHLPYDARDADSAAAARAAAEALIAALRNTGYGIIDESPELKSAVDAAYTGTALAALVEQVRQALSA